ncbi:MAG: AAA family ATPase [Theionarchaea archaeon]|nr:AAA family ATPase [Theionarchaea archaeon]
MRLHDLHIEGFSKFKGQQFQFDPCGLTVVYGDNEMGKTTIKDALCAVIFGFETVEEKYLHRPWHSDVFSASATISSKGHMYRIKRDFESDLVSICRVTDNSFIFEGYANPRGKSADLEVYSDFLSEHMGFSTPDIFRLTTLVSQVNTKTEISEKIRQLISGAEETDYLGIVEEMEAELSELTRDFPGSNLRRKRRIEEIEERIQELSRGITNSLDQVQTFGQYQFEMGKVTRELEELKHNHEAKKESLEALRKYIQVENDLETAQRRLDVFGKEVKLLQDMRKSIPEPGKDLHKWIPLIVFTLACVLALTTWISSHNLLIVVLISVSGMIAATATYFFAMKSALSSEISQLKKASVHPNDMGKMEKEISQLQKEMLQLDTLKKALLSEYPFFALKNLDKLIAYQEKWQREVGTLQEEIWTKEDALHNLERTCATVQEKSADAHTLQEERILLQEELILLTKRKKALITALSVLRECIQEYQNTHIDELENLLSRSFKKITHETYEHVILERPTMEPILSSRSKSDIKKESLSVGAREQLYFAMRLSTAYLLSKNMELPFLLDDPFVNYDRKRLENARSILDYIQKTNQVILFVHDAFYKEWGTSVIDLNEMTTQ